MDYLEGVPICGEKYKAIDDCLNVEVFDARICSLIVFSTKGNIPNDWKNRDGWENTIDNKDKSGVFGKYLVTDGALKLKEKIKVQYAKGQSKVVSKLLALELSDVNLQDNNYDFHRFFQSSDYDFRFFFETESGKLYGKSGGIAPLDFDCDFPLLTPINEIERANITINFFLTSTIERIDSPVVQDNAPQYWQTPGDEFWTDPDGDFWQWTN